MDKKLFILIFCFIATSLMMLTSSSVNKAEANLLPTCTPTPTPTPCIIPTPTPSLTPEVTPSPTPEVSPEVTPTPTPTPETTTETKNETTSGGVGGPWSCTDSTPGIPSLLNVAKTGSKALVAWNSVSGANHYALSYGLTAGNYIYGVADTGNTTSFTVSDLDPNQSYCFAVRAVNGCAPGGLSNEICTGQVLGTSTGKVLGLSTTSSGGSIYDILSLAGTLCFLLTGLSFLPQKRLI